MLWRISVLIVVVFASCDHLVPIVGNGSRGIFEQPLSEFNAIAVRGSAKVRFHQSEGYRALVTVDDNLIEFVEVELRNGILNIGMKRGMYSFTEFLVDVYGPTLHSVSISGSGHFALIDSLSTSSFAMSISGAGTIDGIVHCQELSVKIPGSGNIHLSGSSKHTDIHISGSGKLIGNNFTTNNAHVRISGSGKVVAQVVDQLNASISGSGTISYGGKPQVQEKISGSGRVRQLE